MLLLMPENSLSNDAHATMLACRVLSLVTYCSMTSAVIYRLWSASQRSDCLLAGGGRYKGALLMVAESGAVFAATSVVVFALSVAQTPTVAAVILPTTQLAVRPILLSWR